MAAWSVNIVPGNKPGDPAEFISHNQPSAPAGTLYVDPGDVVSWNNTTRNNHHVSLLQDQPVVTPGHQTSAWLAPASGTVTYHCLIHQNETGTIVVS
jgi:plastocyanin